MLNIFWYGFWPSVHLLWRNVFLDLLDFTKGLWVDSSTRLCARLGRPSLSIPSFASGHWLEGSVPAACLGDAHTPTRLPLCFWYPSFLLKQCLLILPVPTRTCFFFFCGGGGGVIAGWIFATTHLQLFQPYYINIFVDWINKIMHESI